MKKFFTFLIAGIFAGLSLTTTNAAFSDVNDFTPYKDSIEYVQSAGIVSGFSDGSYKAYNDLTRAEFIKIVVNARFSEDEINVCTSSGFPDVQDSNVFVTFICTAKNNGVVGGFSDGNYYPQNTITAAEAMKIISNAYGLTNVDSGPAGEVFRPFVDALDAKNAIPSSILTLNSNMRRAEMSEIIYRIDNSITSKSSQSYSDLQIDLNNIVSQHFGDTTADTQVGSQLNITTTYDLNGELIVSENPQVGLVERASNIELTYAVSNLLPSASKSSLVRYGIGTDGSGNVGASTGYLLDPSNNVFHSLVLDKSDLYVGSNLDKTIMVPVMIHEAAHMISNNSSQLVVNPSVQVSYADRAAMDSLIAECGSKFVSIIPTGCYNSGSYMDSYFDTFWADIFEENRQIHEGPSNEFLNSLLAFRDSKPNTFPSFYASSDPYEDFAETFTYFVLVDRPGNDTELNRKVNFFYNYPELVTAREEIRDSLL